MNSALDLTDTLLDGRYRLTRLMGEGGMGQVYEGVHEQLARKIAVKVLLPRFAYDTKFRERFLREARATSKIRHPNIVQLLDFGATPHGSVYFAMEFLEGRDLSSMLKEEGHLTWPRARHLLLQMISALGAAHQHEVVHRDVKPGNFFIVDAFGHKEFIKVLDFGIAKITTNPDENRTLAQSLTGTGEIFGTAKYMAPEQAFGDSNDLRVDIYSLGVVAYQMLTGEVPFNGDSAFQIITRHVNEPPRAPRTINPSIPAAVEQVILRAIAKRPEDRFASMDELRIALADLPVEGGKVPYVAPVRESHARLPEPDLGFPSVRLSQRPLGAHSKTGGRDPLANDDSDSLRLEAFAPVNLGGTPLHVPLAINPFKSITSPEPAEPEPAGNPFKSVTPSESEVEPAVAEPLPREPEPGPADGFAPEASGPDVTSPTPPPDAFEALGAQETAPVFTEEELAAFETLRALSAPRSPPKGGIDGSPSTKGGTDRSPASPSPASSSPAFTDRYQKTQTPATLPFVKASRPEGFAPGAMPVAAAAMPREAPPAGYGTGHPSPGVPPEAPYAMAHPSSGPSPAPPFAPPFGAEPQSASRDVPVSGSGGYSSGPLPAAGLTRSDSAVTVVEPPGTPTSSSPPWLTVVLVALVVIVIIVGGAVALWMM